MAVLPTVKGIRREDLGPEAPSWVDQLLSPLSSFMEAIYSAFNKQITFTENIACKFQESTFTTSSAYSTGTFDPIIFPSGLRGRANGVIALSATDQTNKLVIKKAVSLAWEDLSGDIKINYITGLENSTKYFVRMLVI
jgi:hypothetical protein